MALLLPLGFLIILMLRVSFRFLNIIILLGILSAMQLIYRVRRTPPFLVFPSLCILLVLIIFLLLGLQDTIIMLDTFKFSLLPAPLGHNSAPQ